MKPENYKLFRHLVAAFAGAFFLAALFLPAGGSVAQGAAGGQYTVKSGDTLYLISRSKGITVSQLKAANHLSSDIIYPGQSLTLPATADLSSLPLWDILQRKGISASASNLSIVVDKSAHTLSLFSGGIWLKYYHVELGDSGLADKQFSGDHKTPEGRFYITEKTVFNPPDYYLGSRWMRLSYPNREDADRGLGAGIINQSVYNQIVTAIARYQTPPQRTALGGGIGIHGGDIPSFQNDWTWGCVGLTNKNVEDFYDYVRIGTPVTIVP